MGAVLGPALWACTAFMVLMVCAPVLASAATVSKGSCSWKYSSDALKLVPQQGLAGSSIDSQGYVSTVCQQALVAPPSKTNPVIPAVVVGLDAVWLEAFSYEYICGGTWPKWQMCTSYVQSMVFGLLFTYSDGSRACLGTCVNQTGWNTMQTYWKSDPYNLYNFELTRIKYLHLDIPEGTSIAQASLFTAETIAWNGATVNLLCGLRLKLGSGAVATIGQAAQWGPLAFQEFKTDFPSGTFLMGAFGSGTTGRNAPTYCAPGQQYYVPQQCAATSPPTFCGANPPPGTQCVDAGINALALLVTYPLYKVELEQVDYPYLASNTPFGTRYTAFPNNVINGCGLPPYSQAPQEQVSLLYSTTRSWAYAVTKSKSETWTKGLSVNTKFSAKIVDVTSTASYSYGYTEGKSSTNTTTYTETQTQTLSATYYGVPGWVSQWSFQVFDGPLNTPYTLKYTAYFGTQTEPHGTYSWDFTESFNGVQGTQLFVSSTAWCCDNYQFCSGTAATSDACKNWISICKSTPTTARMPPAAANSSGRATPAKLTSRVVAAKPCNLPGGCKPTCLGMVRPDKRVVPGMCGPSYKPAFAAPSVPQLRVPLELSGVYCDASLTNALRSAIATLLGTQRASVGASCWVQPRSNLAPQKQKVLGVTVRVKYSTLQRAQAAARNATGLKQRLLAVLAKAGIKPTTMTVGAVQAVQAAA